ncbi:tetratricopeptide repeat protein [Chryseobacterium sp. RP-3-3]|uniref:Tetratricopeptide repeat protein n=1 Tax=Chryseobacterium antibioticum TaxID=2728847 RepID=A0A7Y0APV9_9FLAO|nr:tetratricopeptide repeat protein [Chryseobacterium antibioticum]NML71321.1 tetratricopeptide repeat protein [Chryseobacterium antibioticum]
MIVLNQQMIRESEKIHYSKGIAKGYMNIGNAFLIVGDYQKSLRFLKLAEEQDYLKQDNVLLSSLYVEYGKIYEQIGIYSKANQSLDKAIYYARKKNDENSKKMLGYAYGWKALSTTINKTPDSALYYLHKASKIEPLPSTIINISQIHLKLNNIDSAEFYAKQAWNKVAANPDLKFHKATVIWGLADICFQKKQFEKALEYYQQSAEMYQGLKKKEDMRTLYQKISVTYDSLKRPDKAKEYLMRYTVLNDSLNVAQKQILNISIEDFLNEQEQKNRSSQQKLYYVIGSITVVGLILVFFGFQFYKKRKKEQKVKISDLEQKVSVVYDEVMQLAKNNDPAFFGKFREVYPEFCDKLLKINPGLVNSELKFCALLFLNFSTKEIATYTYVQPGAVRIRKNRIRKKLDIPSDQDINIWINTLINGD